MQLFVMQFCTVFNKDIISNISYNHERSINEIPTGYQRIMMNNLLHNFMNLSH